MQNNTELINELSEWISRSKAKHEDGLPVAVYHASRADICEFEAGSFFAEDKNLAERFYDGKRGHFRYGARTLYKCYISVENPLDLRGLIISESISKKQWLKALGIREGKWNNLIKKYGKAYLYETRNKLGTEWGINLDDLGGVGGRHSNELSDELVAVGQSTFRLWEIIERKPVIEALKALGYDGVRLHESLPAMDSPLHGMKKRDKSIKWNENVASDTWQIFSPNQVRFAAACSALLNHLKDRELTTRSNNSTSAIQYLDNLSKNDSTLSKTKKQ